LKIGLNGFYNQSFWRECTEHRRREELKECKNYSFRLILTFGVSCNKILR
jgi:hypothetical protein